MSLIDAPRNIDTLKVLNNERLVKLHQTPIAAVAFDVHGFMQGHDESINQAIIAEEAKLLAKGCVLAAVTGFGDRIHRVQTQPLLPRLHTFGLDPVSVPLYLSTRNGALTTHAYTDEVIAAHPITEEMYEAITTHPLVQAIQQVTRSEVKASLLHEYEDTERTLGLKLHPKRFDNPGIRHDWHNGTQAGYQLTVIYEPAHITQLKRGDPSFEHVLQIIEQCGEIPTTPQAMAEILKAKLAENGIQINVNTAASHPEIDIAVPGSHKGIGCQSLVPLIADHWHINDHEVLLHSIGGGDSPTQNDRPLIRYFRWGVTNVDYWDEGETGPIVLDYSNISDPITRTLELFRRIQVMEK